VLRALRPGFQKFYAPDPAFQEHFLGQDGSYHELLARYDHLSIRQQQAELFFTEVENSTVILYVHLQMADHGDARDFQDNILRQLQNPSRQLAQTAAPTLHG
jgi:hypothetical protein